MFRHVTARAATVGLLALATTSAAWAGPGSLSTEDGVQPIRRVQERAPVAVDAEMSRVRELVYQHLQALGIPTDALRSALIRVDGLAQQQQVDLDLVARTADLALDYEGSTKAFSILRAYSELKTYGQPITEDLSVNGMDTIHAYAPERDPLDESGVPAPEPRAGSKSMGICLTCPNTDFGPFTPTPVWQTHSDATLAGGTDCNWYSFNVTGGFHYTFKTCGPEGSAAWDTVLELYDTTCGSFVARNDQGCSPGSNASLLQYDATYTGLVYLKVRPFNTTATGPYTLAYITTGIACETCINPDPIPLAAPTAACQCISNTTNAGCPSDYYQVSLLAGETYEFTTCPLNCAAATATFDTTLRLWEPVGCTSVGFNDDLCALAGSTTRSTLTYTPVLSGIYRIQVGGRLFTSGASAFGTYTMCYRRTSAACATCAAGPYQLPASTAPTPACQYHTSSVTACQDNWYDFFLTAGLSYEFTTCSTGTCGLGAASFDTILDLSLGCGPTIATDDDGCSGGPRSSLVYPVTTTGNYRLRVRGKASATGSYTLSYRSLGACTPPSSVTVSPNSGVASAGTCCRTETFTVSADASATGPITYTWTTSPDGGAGAVVSAGGGGAPANFSATLCGAGVHVVSVTATNACGSASTNMPYTLLDTQVPGLTVPPDASVPCNAVPPPGPATATDNCTAVPNVTFNEVRVNGPCPDTYELRRTWTATDASSNSTSRTQVIQVSDTSAPILVGVPADASVECNAVPTPAVVTATDNCDPAPAVTFNETNTPGSCPGNYVLTRTWTARDRCNNVSSMTQVVTVVDTQPPNVVPSADQIACLWPPNHQYACFANTDLGLLATDDCSGPVTWQIVGVTSTSSAMQPCGDGGDNHDPDVILSDDGFCVRAERCGQENQTTGGRVYTVQAVATDACGNASAPTNVGTVFVPHDQRGGIACQRATLRPNQN